MLDFTLEYDYTSWRDREGCLRQKSGRGTGPFPDSSGICRVAVVTVQEGQVAGGEAGKAGQSQLPKGLGCKAKMFWFHLSSRELGKT